MIRVRGLQKSFGPVHAVRGVDLDVEAGSLLVLLGQNGAGKSTTLRCLGGILRPDAGEIEFGSLRLPAAVDRVRRRLGVVPDQARLYGRCTAFEYLDHFGRLYGVPDGVREQRINRLLERFDLDARDDQVLWSYSKGMAQKVALIRATLHEPDWIFCDEPTAGLDPVAAADMRRYLREQAERGAALIVTTHILPEAELMADRIAIMRAGQVMAAGGLEELKRLAEPRRHFQALLADGSQVQFEAPWDATPAELGRRAAELQSKLAAEGRPYYRLVEAPVTLEGVYLHAMTAPEVEAGEQPPAAPPPKGILPSRLLGSLREQPARLAYLLPFYVSSWWRRGDLPWVLWLNGFVLLLIGGASIFGSLPGGLGSLGKVAPGGSALQAGLLLPLFFMSFALMESIKTSIGIWWEKAQQSLEVLLYTPLDDPSLIWLEVLPGAVVSAVWVTLWMAAGMAVLAFFGRPAPWDLLPVFAFIGVLTAYWAAMGRMLGFMLFPREGAAGGAWSFLLSPVSAAVADLPLAAFLLRSPLAPLSLLLPLGACLALSVLCAASFDRERLMDSGLTRTRERRRLWSGTGRLLRRNAGAVGLALLLAAVPAVAGSVADAGLGLHSWSQVEAAVQGHPLPASPPAGTPGVPAVHAGGVAIAGAVMAGITGGFALALLLLALNFAAFFLLGLPELLLLIGAGLLWGVQAGFGAGAPLSGWLGLAGGVVVLGLALNTAAALPIYHALVFGAGGRVERLRHAWSEYFALYRGLVLPCCALFGTVVLALLVTS